MEEPSKIPRCIGIIMDGNRRYARERNLPTFEGHKQGFSKAKEVARWCRDAGVEYVILYAFSNENWNRSKEEVSYLTDLFYELMFNDTQELRRENGAIKFIGDISRFGAKFEAQAKYLENTNPTNPSATVVVALSYGGRQEILRAVNKLLKEKREGTITEEEFSSHLYTAGIPDPDIIIRTSGEKRLSNFLPWQGIYSELFFVEKHWPEVTQVDFTEILKEYAARERRHGK
jgi:undecaprenyl diphosphate synthase